MRVLALDTSTEYCSVALWQDGAVAERCELAGQKHSELLIAMLDELLREAGVKLAQPPQGGRRGVPNGSAITFAQVDGIAFGKGPGSFTGVRIACGATQGLALGSNLPVVGVCTLQALAEASGKPRVIAALDARMGEIYHAVYEKHDDVWTTVSEPCLCKPGDAPQVSGGDWFGIGSGFAMHGVALNKRYAGQLRGADGAAVPQAAAIAALGAAQFVLGRGVDAAEALPLYLREKVALKTSERENARSTSTAPARSTPVGASPLHDDPSAGSVRTGGDVA